MKLEISLFKFDKNSDYLPYYTKHFLKIEDEKNILDILNTINKSAKLGFTNSSDFDLVINGIFVKASITLEEVVKNFGKELTIEPISIRRAYDDLLIDENDFKEKIKILKDLAQEEDKLEYLKLKQYFYASNTLNYKSDYIGDAILILAYDLIKKNPSIGNFVLLALDNVEIGAQYHTSLEKRIYNFDMTIEEKIQKIQDNLNFFEPLEKQNFRLNKTLIIDFGTFEENYEIKHDFKDFNIAYYPSKNSTQTVELLNKLDAKILNLDSMKLDLAKNTFNKNPIITYHVAATILLDAFDNNADFLVVDTNEDFYIFDYNRKQLEKICGREVLLPIIHKNELQKLASGNHKEASKTLVKHQINPEII
jgi:succinate dehydrogenase/fumarate reductase-like Fe-S protein